MRRHWRWIGPVLAALGATLTTAEGLEAAEVRATARITSQTTTTLIVGVTGQTIGLLHGSLCVDGNGAATGVALQDTTGVNFIGTGIVYVLNPGQCLEFPWRVGVAPYGLVIPAGRGLNVVTTVGNGPLEVYLEAVQR